jgi:hypothetical protein
LIAAVWRYAVASLMAGLATAIITRGLISASSVGAATALEAIVIISSVFVTLYLASVVLLYGGFAPIRQLASILRELAPSRKVSRTAGEPLGGFE